MNQGVTQLVDFRENIHQSFPYRSDATMELIDAIAGNTSAQSPVALSLNSLFHRQYSSLLMLSINFLFLAVLTNQSLNVVSSNCNGCT
jgi:hypothetical protein